MTDQDAIKYNQRSANELGWTPAWFGAKAFDTDLIKKIVAFQKAHKLTPDGLCGPTTYRHIFTAREAGNGVEDDEKSIIYAGKPFRIKWDKVVLWNEPKGLRLNTGTYTQNSMSRPRQIGMFITHWDVCLSSASCVKVLNDRKVSVQFCIDNDGTIYQLADMQHTCWHAGSRVVNAASVGVEISNAYSTKYNDLYEERGFGRRPVIKGQKVHGKPLGEFLGFYPVQLEALAALWAAVHEAAGVPLEIPSEGQRVSTDVASGKFKGFACHYHVTERKIDCAGLDMQAVLDRSKGLC
jgi:hypothetical protein